MTAHFDDFTLLQYLVGELDSNERASAAGHLTACDSCKSVMAQLYEVDTHLRGLASAGGLTDESKRFAPGDPFRRRSRGLRAAGFVSGSSDLLGAALRASDEARSVQEGLLAVVGQPERLASLLTALSLADAAHRFGLLYALQEAGRRIAQQPINALGFAQAVMRWLGDEQPSRAERNGIPERLVPWSGLWAQAHVLASLACMWTKDFSQARSSLLTAYRSFAQTGDETGMAIVELTEAQRRAFTHEGSTALALAERARTTFESRGLDDLAARAMVAEGLAYSALDRQEEAVLAYRGALPVFERYGLWSNYVGALNSIGTCLTKLSRLDEARREYARAFRRFSRETDRYWIGFLRTGLAETLFAARRYQEAAVSASRAAQAFRDLGLRANALIATLLEVESWARHGSMGRARHRLELFWTEVQSEQLLDPSVMRDLAGALAGRNPDFERIALLRAQVEEVLLPRVSTK
jgi:tetratricopeptide (TPR) repeat protein